MNCIESRMASFARLRMAFGAWRARANPYKRIRALESSMRDLVANIYYEVEDKKLSYPVVMDIETTLRMIIDCKLSVYRYGDGEFEMMAGTNMSFQKHDVKMQQMLLEAFNTPVRNCLCCIPDVYGSLSAYTESLRQYWRHVALWSRKEMLSHISLAGRNFGNAFISRPYIGMQDKSLAPRVFELWKELFRDKNILIVEGRYSRVGIGNDLLHGAKSISRIWCPPTNAFVAYDEIVDAIEQNSKGIDIIVLALGGVATILAYNLSKRGYWAIDAGHVDIEYCWMKMGAVQKVPIPGRYVNECYLGGREMKPITGEEELNNVVAIIG